MFDPAAENRSVAGQTYPGMPKAMAAAMAAENAFAPRLPAVGRIKPGGS